MSMRSSNGRAGPYSPLDSVSRCCSSSSSVSRIALRISELILRCPGKGVETSSDRVAQILKLETTEWRQPPGRARAVIVE